MVEKCRYPRIHAQPRSRHGEDIRCGEFPAGQDMHQITMCLWALGDEIRQGSDPQTRYQKVAQDETVSDPDRGIQFKCGRSGRPLQ